MDSTDIAHLSEPRSKPHLTELDIVQRQCEVSEEEAVEMLRCTNGDAAEAIARHLHPQHTVAPEKTPCNETVAQLAIRELREIVDAKNVMFDTRMTIAPDGGAGAAGEGEGEGAGAAGEGEGEGEGEGAGAAGEGEGEGEGAGAAGEGTVGEGRVVADDAPPGTDRLAAEFAAFCHSG